MWSTRRANEDKSFVSIGTTDSQEQQYCNLFDGDH